MRTGVIIVVAVLILAASGTDRMPLSARFCDIVSSPESYDGKTLSIDAILQPSFHSLSLYDSACVSKQGFDVSTEAILSDGWDSQPIGKKLRNLIRHGQAANVRLVGTFRSSVTRGQDGQRFRFSVSQVISASKDVSKP